MGVLVWGGEGWGVCLLGVGGYILENILYRIFGVGRFLRFCEVGRNRKGMEKKLEMVFEPPIGEGEVEEAARAYSIWALGDRGGNGGVGARMGPCGGKLFNNP